MKKTIWLIPYLLLGIPWVIMIFTICYMITTPHTNRDYYANLQRQISIHDKVLYNHDARLRNHCEQVELIPVLRKQIKENQYAITRIQEKVAGYGHTINTLTQNNQVTIEDLENALIVAGNTIVSNIDEIVRLNKRIGELKKELIDCRTQNRNTLIVAR